MKTATMLALALALTTAACTSEKLPGPAEPAPEVDGKAEGPSPDTDADDTPRKTDADNESPEGLPDQPPRLVGTWRAFELRDFDQSTTRILTLLADGTGAIEGWDNYSDPVGSPDYLYDSCSWLVAADDAAPTPRSPWVVQIECKDFGVVSYGVIALSDNAFTAKCLSFPLKDEGAATYRRQELAAPRTGRRLLV